MERKWKIGNGNVIVAAHKRNMQGAYVGRYSDFVYYGGELICETVDKKSIHIIAVAPEMLSLLKKFMTVCDINEHMNGVGYFYSIYKEALDLIERVEPKTKLLPQYSKTTTEYFKNLIK